MNILITGVNGLVGKAIAKCLVQDHNVSGVSRAVDNKTSLPVEYYSIDLSVLNSFDVIMDKQIDVIVHCAASLDTYPLSNDLITSNCLGIRNIADLAIQKKCKQFIYISSIPIIGKPIDIPITEEHSINPLTAYHITKYFGELYLANVLKDCNLTTLRLPSPIGSDLNANKIIPVFIRRSIKNEDITIAGKGERIQNYIDVKDIAKAVDLAIKNNTKGVYNIAAEKSYSNREIAEICIKLFNSNSKIIYEGMDSEEEHKWIISIEKAKKDFNFSPSILLEVSIQEIAKTYII
jgi:UDP-glucose 4-epimerase